MRKDLLSKDLRSRVGEILHGYNMLSPGDHVGVAVSGGADSVVLLHLLCGFLPDREQRLFVLHANHKLRGSASDEDQQFVAELAARLGLPFQSSDLPVGSGNLEQEARRERHRFFRKCQAQFGLQRIALGHTRSDQAETLLFRVLRGTGVTGFSGMAPTTPHGLIRPLLFCSRAEIRDFARSESLAWREDQTNTDLRFSRNRLRLVILPQLTDSVNPNLEKILSQSAGNASTEEDFWQRKTAVLFRRLVRGNHFGLTIEVAKLFSLHLALQRRLIRKLLRRTKSDLRSIDSRHVELILAVGRSRHGHDRIMVPGTDVVRSFGTLLFAAPGRLNNGRGFELPARDGVPIPLPVGFGTLQLTQYPYKEQNCVTVKEKDGFVKESYLDCEALGLLSSGGVLKLRNWEPGDQFQPQASSRPEKIKQLFQDNQVLLWERRHWPVLVASGQVVWAYRFGPDRRYLPQNLGGPVLRIICERDCRPSPNV